MDYFAGLRLTLWYVGLGLEKYSNCLFPHGLISGYIGLWLEKCRDYLTGVRMIFKKLGIKNTWTTMLYICCTFDLDWLNKYRLSRLNVIRKVWRVSWIIY